MKLKAPGWMALACALVACGQKAEDAAVKAEATALDRARADAFATNVSEGEPIAEDAHVYNKDNSLALYPQDESPGEEREVRWLPAPKTPFIPMQRMYWPKATPPSIFDGSWTPPKLMKATR